MIFICLDCSETEPGAYRERQATVGCIGRVFHIEGFIREALNPSAFLAGVAIHVTHFGAD
jgi:hypothetical protein